MSADSAVKTLERLESRAAFGGRQEVWRHVAPATGGRMTFSVYLPPEAAAGPRPVLIYLSGLTCTHLNVTEKGGFQGPAAARGLIVVCPDTSPRGEGVPDDEAFDLGQGAGFYLDAARAPWAGTFRMETYVMQDLLAALAGGFPADMGRLGLTGHSMGGHGALTLALRHQGRFASVSAFAPIAAPMNAPWGRKAFAAYLGEDEALWADHDASRLIAAGARTRELLVDVGAADPFLESQLMPERLEDACRTAGQPLTLRRQPGYDHSYYFVASFMADHIAWHADRLGA
jgi:S-formylglutathione hydrolase